MQKNESELDKIITQAVEGQKKEGWLLGVSCEPIINMDGHELLRVVLTLTPDDVKSLGGRESLDVLVAIRDALEREGEDRFPMVEYTDGKEDEDEDEDEEAGDAD